MFCRNCGAMLEDDVRFCPMCGMARASDARPAQVAVPQPQATAHRVSSGRTGRGKLIAIIVLAVIVVALLGIGAYLLAGGTGTDQEEEETTEVIEVYYNAGETLEVEAQDTVVMYSKENEPLEHYRVTWTPRELEDESQDFAEFSFSLSGETGFSLSDFELDIYAGTYDVAVYDEDSGETYYCPVIEIAQDIAGDDGSDDGEAADGADADEEGGKFINIVPDPQDPESATEAPEVEYSFTIESVEVTYDYGDLESVEAVTATWTYPQFTSSVESDAVDAINEALEADFEQTYEATVNYSGESADYGQCQDYDVSVTYCKDNIVSVRCETYVMGWGAAHGISSVTGAIYDLETGEETSVEEVLGVSTDEKEQAAVDALQTYLESDPSDLYEVSELTETMQSISELPERYYLSKYGLVVATGDYELGSFAWGRREIVVLAGDGGVEPGSAIDPDAAALSPEDVAESDDDETSDADAGADAVG